MALGSMDILTILILPIHDHRISSNLFVFTFFHQHFMIFQGTDLSLPWLNLFLSILLLLMLL